MDPKQRSRGELERAVRRYTASLLGTIGPDQDVFAPDFGTDETVMAWMVDTVSSHARHTESAAVTGKPISLGGTRGHADAVAQGLRTIFKLAIERFGLSTHSVSVTIQGAGTVGGHLARLLHAEGFRVCGFSDLHGALFSEEGLDVPRLLAWRRETGSLRGAPGNYEAISNEELITRPCDVLIPCAVANAVHSRNARAIQTRLIIEGAHGPVSARADRILDNREIPVVPDILANAGGVVVHYFEWVQNRQGMSWIDLVVHKRLTRFMTEAWLAVQKMQEEHSVRLRMAANMLAVRRVAQADRMRGIYA
jgi:glutamate dehydrogenase (NAD(P)+)